MSQMLLDPEDPSKAFIGSAAEPLWGIQTGDATLVNVHPATACLGQACVVHNPSDHHMRDWPLNWRGDRGLMERICPSHGTGHPDPDDMTFHRRNGREWMGVHGCCGCCRVNP